MSSHFGHLFVIDRSIDLASVLLSPVTYEALLDEVFGISCGVVDFSRGEHRNPARIDVLPIKVWIELVAGDPIEVQVA